MAQSEQKKDFIIIPSPAIYNFFNQFQDVVGLRKNLASSTKFSYLKGYLRGYALKVIQHLSVTDQNYEIAVALLKDEFLNIDSLTDTLFKRLLETKPKYDVTYLETKMYLNEVRCILTDLKNYKCDLLKCGNVSF